MSTDVNPNALKLFLVNDLGIRKLDKNQAQKYDIDEKKFEEADTDDNGLEVNEILQDSDLYAQFAAIFEEEKAKKSDSEDSEKKKEEEKKVDKKAGSGAA